MVADFLRMARDGARETVRRPPAGRRLAAATLQGAARGLARWSARLAAPQALPTAAGALDLHAEAGAPEGAFVVDGVPVCLLAHPDRR